VNRGMWTSRGSARTNQRRREQCIGNWGRASEHIGKRWEELGEERLAARLKDPSRWPVNAYVPLDFLTVASDSELSTSVLSAGLRSPDVVLLLRDARGVAALQSLDFKWTIEYATYEQIRGEALAALLAEAATQLRPAIESRLGKAMQETVLLDGVLFAPDSVENRTFLASAANQRQEYPIESHEVIFEPVSGSEFFGPLPGWGVGRQLAVLDRAARLLETLEGAERYYRLGAGLQGAAAMLRSSIFDEEPPAVDADETMQWLISTTGGRTTDEFVDRVEKAVARRNELQTRLRSLFRLPLRFSSLLYDMRLRSETRLSRDEDLTPEERVRWGGIIKQVAAEHKALVMQRGRELIARGDTDTQAITAINDDWPQLSAHARRLAESLVRAQIKSAD
jgi:hypothetical protein